MVNLTRRSVCTALGNIIKHPKRKCVFLSCSSLYKICGWFVGINFSDQYSASIYKSLGVSICLYYFRASNFDRKHAFFWAVITDTLLKFCIKIHMTTYILFYSFATYECCHPRYSYIHWKQICRQKITLTRITFEIRFPREKLFYKSITCNLIKSYSIDGIIQIKRDKFMYSSAQHSLYVYDRNEYFHKQLSNHQPIDRQKIIEKILKSVRNIH